MDSAKDVNVECLGADQVQDGIPLSFGFEYEPKGNVTFTYTEGVKH